MPDRPWLQRRVESSRPWLQTGDVPMRAGGPGGEVAPRSSLSTLADVRFPTPTLALAERTTVDIESIQAGRPTAEANLWRTPLDIPKAYLSGAAKGLTFGLVRPFGNDYEGTLAEGAGEGLAMLAPYGAAYKGASALIKIPQEASWLTRSALGAARGAAVGAGTGSIRSFGDLMHGGEFSGGNVASEAALFGAIDAAMPMAGQLAGLVKRYAQQGKTAAARRMLEQSLAKYGTDAQRSNAARRALDQIEESQSRAEMIGWMEERGVAPEGVEAMGTEDVVGSFQGARRDVAGQLRAGRNAAREARRVPGPAEQSASVLDQGVAEEERVRQSWAGREGLRQELRTEAEAADGLAARFAPEDEVRQWTPWPEKEPVPGPAQRSAEVLESELNKLDALNKSPQGREGLRVRLQEAADNGQTNLFSIGGAGYGFDQDDEGNITFDPTKAMVGLGLGLVAGHYSGRVSKNVRDMMRGKIPAKVNEPILTKEAAKASFSHELPKIQLQREAPGAVGTAFETVKSVGRMKRAGHKFKDLVWPTGLTRDFHRNSLLVFGNRRTGQYMPEFEQEILQPMERARGINIDFQKAELADLESVVMGQYGIKPWTKESQYLFRAMEDRVSYDDLIKEFGEERAQQIMEASKWARGKLDGLRDQVNAVREVIYPGDPGKQVPYRKNYIHHMQSLSGYEPLMQLIETPEQISPALQGISAATRPKSKFLGFSLPRGMSTRFTEDFHASYVKYIRDASHAINIDPQIANLRAFRTSLAEEMGAQFIVKDEAGGTIRTFADRGSAEEFAQREWSLVGPGGQVMGTYKTEAAAKGAITKAQNELTAGGGGQLADYTLVKRGEYKIDIEEGSGGLNGYLWFLDEYANRLAGKSNPVDRVFTGGGEGGRKFLSLLDWTNRRVKGNTVLGSARSSVAQFYNLPQAVAEARSYMVPGAHDTIRSIFRPNPAMAQSGFIKERYFDSAFNKFDVNWIRRGMGLQGNAARPYAKQFLAWMLRAGDEAATKWTWNSFYRKGVAEGVSDPIIFADRMTRQSVGGRAFGEAPIAQSSKALQLFVPFTLEMGNAVWAMQDLALRGGPWTRMKALAVFTAVSWGMNEAARRAFGDDVSFDPVNAFMEGADVLNDESMDQTERWFRAGGRVAGEALSNVPGGNWMAGLYPEYGLGDDAPTRRELFGSNDPTRYGSGLLVQKGIQQAPYLLAPPFGGSQIRKTVEGAEALDKGYVEDAQGRSLYPIGNEPGDEFRALVFGKYSTPGARQYFRKREENESGDRSGGGRVGGGRKSGSRTSGR